MPMDTQVELWVAVHIASDVYSRVRVDAAQDAVCVDGEALSISPLDKQVLMKALSVSSQVRVVSVCPQTQERALRYAAAMGAPQIFCINDCPRDAYVAAAEVAAFLKDRPQPVVLCGEAGWDYASGDFPRWLSQLSGIALVEGVCDFRPYADDPQWLEVSRQTDAFSETFRVKAPVILSCNKAIYPSEQVRIPSMREMMLAMRSQVHLVPPAGDFSPRKEYSGYRMMPARASVRFLPPEDFGQMADVFQQALADAEGSSSEGETPVFSGRILARVSTLEDPLPLSAQTEQVDRQPMPLHVDVRTAPLVVSGGMGVDPSLWPLLEQLARDGSGATACTRPVYQAGRRPYFEHVGQTGAKVAPALYLAVGISGALQHIAGMIRSRKVLAINTDPQAEIFKYADYGVVGDAGRVLPGLVEELRRRSGSLANASANNK